MTIQELREKRAKAWDTARDFLDSKRQADGTLSEEDSKTYDAMEATIVNLGKEIQRMERQAEIEADMAKATSAPILTTPATQNTEPEKTGTASAAYSDAFWNSRQPWMRHFPHRPASRSPMHLAVRRSRIPHRLQRTSTSVRSGI